MNGMYIKFKSIILIRRALPLLGASLNVQSGCWLIWVLASVDHYNRSIYFYLVLVLSHPSLSINQLSSHLFKPRGVQNSSENVMKSGTGAGMYFVAK